MVVLCIAQVEHREHLDQQILNQTVQPDRVIFYQDESPAVGIENRRKRIAENHQILRTIVEAYKPDLIWQVEQDGVYPEDTLERLIEHYVRLKNDDFGYISGIQVGRHGLYCLGAWKNFTETHFESIDYKLTGLQEVEATGFYCLLAERETWLSGVASWNGEPYGPDVVWGRSINKKKYVDMNLKIGHKTKTGVILPEHISTCNVQFDKIDERWSYKII